VTRVQSDGSVLLVEPNFVLSDQRVILPVVELTVEDREIAGSRTVLVRSERELRDVEVDRGELDRLELNVTTPAADAWAGYLEGEGMDCTRPDGPDGDRLSCESENLDRVLVVRYTIDVSFE
jgi:hypothetical protein